MAFILLKFEINVRAIKLRAIKSILLRFILFVFFTTLVKAIAKSLFGLLEVTEPKDIYY